MFCTRPKRLREFQYWLNDELEQSCKERMIGMSVEENQDLGEPCSLRKVRPLQYSSRLRSYSTIMKEIKSPAFDAQKVCSCMMAYLEQGDYQP